MNSRSILRKALAFLLFLAAAGVAPLGSAGETSPTPKTETVHVTYHVRVGKEGELARVLARHWPTCRRLGLVLEKPHIIVRGYGEGHRPYFVEILTWKDSDAPDNAPPEVRAIWKDLEALCEKRDDRPGIEIDEVEIVSGDSLSS